MQSGTFPGPPTTSADGLAGLLAADLAVGFERLVLAYQDQLYGFGRALSGSPEEGEEIAQEAFVRAYRALRRYAPARVEGLLLRPWLHRIALNVFRNRVRRPRLLQVGLDGADALEDGQPGPESLALVEERRRELAGLVARLPEHYRAAVVLRHVQGLSYAEVAAALAVPVGTAKAHVHRGLRLLRSALEEEEVERTKPWQSL